MTSPALEQDLLEAIPAPARRILVIGEALMAHRDAWLRRNPLAQIETANGPWKVADADAPKFDAAILDVTALAGDAAAAAVWSAGRLERGATLALFVGPAGDRQPIDGIAAGLAEQGLVAERTIGDTAGAAHALWRFVLPGESRPSLRVAGHRMPGGGKLDNEVVRVRMAEPLEQLRSLPFVRTTLWTGHPADGPPPVEDAGAANILVLQRTLFVDPSRYLQPAYAANYITVAELDDLVMDDKDNTGARYKQTLAGFHAVQVSTPLLAKHLGQYHPEIGVFGNHLPRLRPLPPKPAAPIRILFAAISRDSGWTKIVKTYREIAAGYGDRITTVVVGDRKFFDTLQLPHSEFKPLLPYPDYLAELAQSHIALLPLGDNTFDRCKTDLKFIECAEAGAVVLASRTVYSETVRSSVTGFVYQGEYDFGRHLRTLIDNAPMREALAANAHSYAGEHRALANHVRQRQEWYLSLVERREELDRQVKQRLGLS